jgi:DNA recombination protein Rad52
MSKQQLPPTNVSVPPPMAPRSINMPPPVLNPTPSQPWINKIESRSTPPLLPPLVSDKEKQTPNQTTRAYSVQTEDFNSSLDANLFKDKFLEYIKSPRDDMVTKEQAKLDKLELMIMNMNNAINSKLSQPNQIQAQPQTVSGGSVTGQYKAQPGLEIPLFKSVKKRKAESGVEKDETEELLKRKVDESEIKIKDGSPYIDNYTATKNATEILGYDGWSDIIVSSSVLVASVENSKYYYEVVVLMRMFLENGSYREDYGFGKATRSSKGEALVMALKSAATMARKRLWRLCGEYMGNCLYDKKYTEEVIAKRRKTK